MARSIWQGSIAFGLLNIPVSLTAAESRPDIQLHMVDSKNHARIRYERVNADTGAEVPWGRLVKGYEHENGKFVLEAWIAYIEKKIERGDTVDDVVRPDGDATEEIAEGKVLDLASYLEPSLKDTGGARAKPKAKPAAGRTPA